MLVVSWDVHLSTLLQERPPLMKERSFLYCLSKISPNFRIINYVARMNNFLILDIENCEAEIGISDMAPIEPENIRRRSIHNFETVITPMSDHQK